MMKTTLKILLSICSIILLSGCIFNDINDNAATKRAGDNARIVYQGEFGTIKKINIPDENLTCYIRIDNYEGGLSCFDGVR